MEENKYLIKVIIILKKIINKLELHTNFTVPCERTAEEVSSEW